MFRNKTKISNILKNNNADTSITLQHNSNTKVESTMEETQTTDTVVQTATSIDEEAKTMTYQTIIETMTHEQKSGVTETLTQKTLTLEELKELMSTDGFKTEETIITKDRGYTVTSSMLEERIKLSETTDCRFFENMSLDTTLLSTNYSPIKSFSTTGFTPLYTAAGENKMFQLLPDAQPFSTTNTASTNNLPPYVAGGLPSFSHPDQLNVKPALVLRKVSKLRPGYMFIFNNEEFDDDKLNRNGSSEDVKSLRETFEKIFKLKTEVYPNQTVEKITQIVTRIRNKDFNEYSCLVIVILSHGGRNNFILAKDHSYNFDDTVLLPLLDNPTLKDKPKIFFIQACKGEFEIDLKKDAHEKRGSPAEIFKFDSTFEGFVAYRTDGGSFFIQNLCQHVQNDGFNKDISEIALDVVKDIKELEHGEIQIPTITTTLSKPYKFGDYVPK